MATYISYKGVGEPLVAMGLKGAYIVVAIMIIVASFILAVVLSATTLPFLVSVASPVLSALGLLQAVAYLNGKYGTDGLMKKRVVLLFPEYVRRNARIHQLLKMRKR